MKKYIGTKQIEAEPMTMGEAYEAGLLQAGRVPSEGQGPNAGYHVRYADGYESWSPAEPFEEAYRVVETYVDRLHVEREELSARYNKEREFFYSPKFDRLWPHEKQAFETQVDIMCKYIAVLDERITQAEAKELGHSGIFS